MPSSTRQINEHPLHHHVLLQHSYSPPFRSSACICARFCSAASNRSFIAFSSRRSFSFSSFNFSKFDFRFSNFSYSLPNNINNVNRTNPCKFPYSEDEPKISAKSTLRPASGISGDSRGGVLRSSSCPTGIAPSSSKVLKKVRQSAGSVLSVATSALSIGPYQPCMFVVRIV